MVVYSSGAGVVTKVRNIIINASFHPIAMHVYVICVLVWMRRCASSRSILPIRISFEGHLMQMDAIMWSILRRQKPQKQGCRLSLSTRLFMEVPEGLGK